MPLEGYAGREQKWQVSILIVREDGGGRLAAYEKRMGISD